ncbi:MAG: hypothetical protein ACO3JG_13675 [Luteolibacter sp.]
MRCLRISDWPDFPNRGVMLDIDANRQLYLPAALDRHVFHDRNGTGRLVCDLDDVCKVPGVEIRNAPRCCSTCWSIHDAREPPQGMDCLIERGFTSPE